ncbi:hypothetical protein [Streptomyces sp. NPDC059564]|uniref:hypothetical protein n=1 Tax=Streptomyces sp. NPDC059564 TaxID=3346865 RepID=UPI003688C277
MGPKRYLRSPFALALGGAALVVVTQGQAQASSLVAVTARSNRQKADQDPFEWLPPASDALCRYASEWTATKLRWQLAVDQNEQSRLFEIAAGYGNTVTYTPAL